jgi:hypothetical protein
LGLKHDILARPFYFLLYRYRILENNSYEIRDNSAILLKFTVKLAGILSKLWAKGKVVSVPNELSTMP